MRPWARRPCHAVAQILRCRIEDGTFQPGYPLPSIASMSATLGVSRRTVAAATMALRGTYLEARLYYGLYVRPRCHWQAPSPDRRV